MTRPTPTLARFAQISRDRHAYAKDWRARTGGKVLGYFCTYVPEEIVYAAGILPVRVLGSGSDVEASDGYVAPTWCAFSRACLAEGLRGEYSYLDGVIYAYSCLHMMQAFDAWVRHVPTSFGYFLEMPWDVAEPAARSYSLRELRSFREALGKHFGHDITDSAIEHSIAVYNENRRLLHELYKLRNLPRPPISGTEALQVTLAGQCMDKAEHSALLLRLLDELRERQLEAPDLRFMITGSEIDDLDLVQLIESLGAMVVVDESCTGSRYFWNEVPMGDDVMTRVSDRYLSRPPCPLKDFRQPRRRVEHVVSLAKQYRVDGVIFLTQKFCEPHAWDTPHLQKVLEQHGIPSVALEITIPNPTGPLRTRLEAFVEMLALEPV